MNQMTKYEVETLSHSSSFKSYHELLDKPVVEANELERLKMNLKQLEDLHGRLTFMMAEITSLMKLS